MLFQQWKVHVEEGMGLSYLWVPRWCNCGGSRFLQCHWGLFLPVGTFHSLLHKLEDCCTPPLTSSGSSWSQKVLSSARRSQSLAKSDLRWRQLPYQFKHKIRSCKFLEALCNKDKTIYTEKSLRFYLDLRVITKPRMVKLPQILFS